MYSPKRSAALSLAALGLAALAAPAARAQTQALYLSNGNNTISRFAGTRAGTYPTYPTTLTDPSLNGPAGLVLDANGDLFAANSRGGGITEFVAGTTPGTFVATKTLADPSPSKVFSLAMDAHGDLFAGNVGLLRGNITEYLAGTTPGTFAATAILIDPGIDFPSGLAVDARGDLFVANQNNVITEFVAGSTPGAFGPAKTLTDPSLDGVIGLAVDASGNLFAANTRGGVLGYGSVTEFASTGAGTFGPGKFDEGLLHRPQGIAIGPLTPAVPEASTTVSLGLLLALGMGGLVIASRRRKA